MKEMKVMMMMGCYVSAHLVLKVLSLCPSLLDSSLCPSLLDSSLCPSLLDRVQRFINVNKFFLDGTYPLGSRCKLHVSLMTYRSSLEFCLDTDLFQSRQFSFYSFHYLSSYAW
jgi:hypothetical protein